MEGVADDLLQLEFQMGYVQVGNPEKRQRRWKLRWEALTSAVSASSVRDRCGRSDPVIGPYHSSIPSTARLIPPILLAAPSNTGKLHSIASGAARCNSSLHKSTDLDMMGILSAFAELDARRRASCSSSLLEQLSHASSSSRNGLSSRSSNALEDDLRCALDTEISSLHVLGGLYERREMRWIEEKHRNGQG
jgi:hypothetical protein